MCAVPPVRQHLPSVCVGDVSPVTQQELNVLADARLPSGYSSVYECNNRRYRGVVAKTVRLHPCASAREAAAMVVRWYRSRYGADWQHVYKNRKSRWWEVVRVGDGYAAVVWDRGVPMRLSLADCKERPRSGDRKVNVWWSYDEAVRMVRRWAYLRGGLLGWLVFYRFPGHGWRRLVGGKPKK